MIRAHLATFPARRRILRRVVDAILPQVDRLFIVLNSYVEVPDFLARDPKVTAVIPDRDVKDAGKFWFAPDADDMVFCIDDDIGYPADYVSRTLQLGGQLGFDGRVFGYQGNAYAPETEGQRPIWHNYLFHQALPETRGISLIGTGTLCARGDAIAPLTEIEPFAGACDIAYGHWLSRRAILPWSLPRAAEWLTNQLPQNLRQSSLFATVHRARHPAHTQRLTEFAFGWPHANRRFDDFQATAL